MRWLLSYKQPKTEVERTTLRIKADASGNVYIPIGWISSDGVVGVPYKWKVSIDWGNESNYSWTGSSGGVIRVWYWLKPWTIHTVTIKPQVEEYWWCKALSYLNVNSTYKESLINILSDKSYMWYAVSAEDTGNYFKYYQYQGCTNLLDTDDEVLPDTVHFIGNNYRAYEYSWCTSLKASAQEKIFKQVRKIWVNYRTWQYQDCTNLWSVMMRAINWCTIGSWFRSSMLLRAGNWKLKVAIEWWIIEGSAGWWLSDSNVESIQVYKWLVSDYKTILSWITSSKITNNPEWDTNNYEYIEFNIKADNSWNIKIPVAWYSTSWTQDCAYDWMVSVDGWDTVEYTGTGSASAITVWTWTAWTEHRIIIYPKTESWWWGRAFWFYNSWIATLLTEFIHDSYKCYAQAYNNTWNYFRYSTFRGCTLINSIYERLPSSVSTVGSYFHWYDYYGCTWLRTISWEVLPYISSMGTNYREYMFYNCSGITEHLWLYAKPASISSYPSNYRLNMFGNAGNNLVINMWWYEALASWLTNSMWLTNAHLNKLEWISFTDKLNYQDNANWSNLSIDKFHVVSYPFICWPTLDLAWWLQLEWTKQFKYQSWAVKYSDWVWYRDTVYVGWQWIWVSDDEQYFYIQWTYSRAWYNDCLIAYQKMSDLWVVTLPWEQWYSSSWYIRTTSPRWSQHDAYPRWMSLYTSWSYQKWFGWWDWWSYPGWWRWQINQYAMSWNTPTFTHQWWWYPFWYPDSNNNLDRFPWADRLWYNRFGNERWLTIYKYKWWADESLGSTIWSHIEFSDDWEMVYILNWTTITQYRMTKLLNFKTRVSTWKTFTTPASCDWFTIKWWHLYCSVWTTIYKYSIPNT